MKLSRNELGVVAVIILYVAFFTHPPPSHITNFLESPIGHIVSLIGILYVAVYKSLIVGIFLGIAYMMTVNSVTEYLDPKEQTPKKEEEKKQPTSSGVPPPAVTGAMASMMKKGDTRLPQAQGKDVKDKPTTVTPPKPTPPKTVENFASF